MWPKNPKTFQRILKFLQNHKNPKLSKNPKNYKNPKQKILKTRLPKLGLLSFF